MTKTPLCLALVLALLLPPPAAFAQSGPPPVPDQHVSDAVARLRGLLGQLPAPAARLKDGAYSADDHAAVAATLKDLAGYAGAAQKEMPSLAAALTAAQDAEAKCWTAHDPAAQPPAAPEARLAARGALLDGLEAVTGGFGLLLGEPSMTLDADRRKRLETEGGALAKIEGDYAQGLKLGDTAGLTGRLNTLFGGGLGLTDAADGAGGVAGRFSEGQNAASGNAPPPTQKGLVTHDVPAVQTDGAPAVEDTAAARTLQTMRAQEAALLAGDSALRLTPVGDRPTERQLVGVRRDIRLVESAQDGQAWLAANRDALVKKGVDPDKLSARFDAALGQRTDAARRRGLVQAEAELQRVMDRNPSAAELDLRRLPRDATQEQIAAVLARDPAYFKARGDWAQYVEFNRANLQKMPTGARFSGEELGLPPGSPAVTVAAVGGRRGLSSKTPDGLSRFQSFDGKLTRDEVKKDGQSQFVEKKTEGNATTVTTYDAKGRKLSAEVIERERNGAVVMHPEGKDKPRQIGRMERGQFILERVENEDGSGQQRVPGVNGVWELTKNGKPTGWTLDAAGVRELGNPQTRDHAADQLARALVAQGFTRTGGQAQDQYQADSIAAMLKDVFKHSTTRQDTNVYFDAGEGKILVNQRSPIGLIQTVAKFEDTQSGWGVGDGLKKQGLTIYVRTAKSVDDPNAQFTKAFQYLGGWGREQASMQVESNTDSWWSYVSGPKVTETPVVRRLYKNAQGLWQDRGDVNVRLDKRQTVYDGPGIIGATGHAIGAVSGGIVDFAASGIALGLAGSDGYVGLVSMTTGADPNDVRTDLLQRAGANGVTDNRLIAEFAPKWQDKKRKDWGIDSNQAAHNVGREMADAGHPMLGAVLQGGMNFADQMPAMLAGVGVFQKVATLGTVGRYAAIATGFVMGGKGVYDFGATAVDFNTARKELAAHENDPAAQRKYYGELANLIGQGPGMIANIAGGYEMVKAGRASANARPGETVTTPPGAPGENVTAPKETIAAPAAVPNPEVSPAVEANRRLIAEASDAMFKTKGDPQDLVKKFPKIEDIPEVDPAKPETRAARDAAVAKFAQEYLGLKEPPTIKAPPTDPLSGAQIYLIQDGGKVVAVYKVLPAKGGATTVMDEIGAVATFDGIGDNPGANLKNSSVVKPLGAFQVGEGGRVGYMMEAAPGQDVYEILKSVNAAEGSGAAGGTGGARARALAAAEAKVRAVARAMAEMHKAGRSGVVSTAEKAQIVERTMSYLDELRQPSPKRSWTLPEDAYLKLKARIQATGGEFVKGQTSGSFVHGDAHPGNFFVDDTGRVTMIDVETAMESVGDDGQAVGSPGADVGRFMESIRLNNGAKGLGLKPTEITALQDAFKQAYLAESGFKASSMGNQIDFFRAKMEVTALKFAKTSGDFDAFVQQILAEK